MGVADSESEDDNINGDTTQRRRTLLVQLGNLSSREL